MPSAAPKNKNVSNVIVTLLLILVYFPFSIGITFYQQWFVKKEFKYPLFVVLFHYILKFLFASVCRKLYVYSRKCCGGKAGTDWVRLGWRDFVFRLGAVGVAASIDIGLSNWSFQFITVSLYTMAKSSSIIFILLFSVFLSLEKCRLLTFITVGCIAFGLFLFTYQSTQFDVIGFLLVELATVCAGIRWTCSQLLMQKLENGLHHPLDMIYHVQPWMILSIIPLVFGFESLSLSRAAVDTIGQGALPVGRVFGLILCGALIAFMMEIAEYALLVNTSSLTLNVCGIAKEIITLILAHRYKGDQFSSVNIAGLVLCILGVTLHVYSRTTSVKRARKELYDARDDQLGLMDDDQSNSESESRL